MDVDPKLEEKHLRDLEHERVPSYLCNQQTIDFILNVKQTRTLLKQVKEQFNELRDSSELPEPLKLPLDKLLEDWLEVVKYHRKRTFSVLLHNDLIICSRAPSSSAQYQVFFDDEDTRFVDNKT